MINRLISGSVMAAWFQSDPISPFPLQPTHPHSPGRCVGLHCSNRVTPEHPLIPRRIHTEPPDCLVGWLVLLRSGLVWSGLAPDSTSRTEPTINRSMAVVSSGPEVLQGAHGLREPRGSGKTNYGKTPRQKQKGATVSDILSRSCHVRDSLGKSRDARGFRRPTNAPPRLRPIN